MRIRLARADDAPVIATLAGQLGYPSTPDEIRSRMRDILARDDHAVLVLEDEDVVIGWIHVCAVQRIESDPCAEIGGLVVAEAERDRGFGAALVAAAEAWAVARGFTTLRVRSNVVREAAHRFYERHGYTCTKQSRLFSKRLSGGS